MPRLEDKKNTSRLFVRLTPHTHNRLKWEATRSGETLTAIAREAFVRELDRRAEERKLARQSTQR